MWYGNYYSSLSKLSINEMHLISESAIIFFISYFFVISYRVFCVECEYFIK